MTTALHLPPAPVSPSLIIAADNDKRFAFRPGDKAYVRGWTQQENVLILTRLLHVSDCGIQAPHYQVLDSNGGDWQMSQLSLSSKPIVAR